MRPEQLDLIVRPSHLRVHPDGTWAVVATSRPSFEADGYVGQLWRVPLTGHGHPRRLTRGQSDSSPSFSPDGRLIGFLRPDADGKPQLHVVEASGGEPLKLTDQKLGVSEFAFSPDSRSLAFIARVPDDGRYGTLEGVAANQEDPRHITGVKFRMNGVGYTTDKRQHVFLVHLPDLDAEPPVKPVGRVAKQL
ncbi:MAG TPA: S9 family peptidase, partial [Propionibacteriaceae bacterium]|nr:S9 family peptidase [Propionibacteriaceae bacterium]